MIPTNHSQNQTSYLQVIEGGLSSNGATNEQYTYLEQLKTLTRSELLQQHGEQLEHLYLKKVGKESKKQKEGKEGDGILEISTHARRFAQLYCCITLSLHQPYVAYINDILDGNVTTAISSTQQLDLMKEIEHHLYIGFMYYIKQCIGTWIEFYNVEDEVEKEFEGITALLKR